MEAKARALDLGAPERTRLATSVVGWSEEFLQDEEKKAYYFPSSSSSSSSPAAGEGGSGLLDIPFRETPRAVEEVLACFDENVARQGVVNTASGHLVRTIAGVFFSQIR